MLLMVIVMVMVMMMLGSYGQSLVIVPCSI